MDARDKDQAFHTDGTQRVQGWVQMAVKMPPMQSQQLPRGGLPTHASAYSSRLCQEFDEDMENGEKGHLATHSNDDSQKVPPASSATSRNSNMLVTTAVH